MWRRCRWRAGRARLELGRIAWSFSGRVACGFLDVAEGDAGVECGGDERVAERVGADSLGDPGFAGDASNDPGGGVTVQSLTIGTEEQWAFAAFADREIDRASGARRERDDHGLATLAEDREGAMSSLETEC